MFSKKFVRNYKFSNKLSREIFNCKMVYSISQKSITKNINCSFSSLTLPNFHVQLLHITYYNTFFIKLQSFRTGKRINTKTYQLYTTLDPRHNHRNNPELHRRGTESRCNERPLDIWRVHMDGKHLKSERKEVIIVNF